MPFSAEEDLIERARDSREEARTSASSAVVSSRALEASSRILSDIESIIINFYVSELVYHGRKERNVKPKISQKRVLSDSHNISADLSSNLVRSSQSCRSSIDDGPR